MAGTGRSETTAPAKPPARGPTETERARIEAQRGRRVATLVEGNRELGADGDQHQANADQHDQHDQHDQADGEKTAELEVAGTAVAAVAAAVAAQVEQAVAATADADAQVQRFGRLPSIPRHVRSARDLLVDAQAAERIGELLTVVESKLDANEPVPVELVLRFEAAVELWKRDRRIGEVA